MNEKSRWILVAVLLATSLVIMLTLKGQPRTPWSAVPANPQRDATLSDGLALKVIPGVLDFGEIPLGEKKTLALQIENPTETPILIYRLILPCNCLSGVVEKVSVRPNETVNLPVSFAGLPGRSNWNIVASFVTDEAGACKYDIPVIAKVLQEFILEPEVLSFGKVLVGSAVTAQTVIRRRDGGAFAVVAVTSSRPEFSFSWAPSPAGSTTAYSISASLTTRRPGTMLEMATVLTDRGQSASAVAILGAEVEGDLSCTPGIATAIWNRDQTVPSFDLVVRNRTGAKVRVTDVKESRGTPLSFQEEAGPAGESRLKVLFKERIPKGVPVGEFILTVEGELEPLRVAYRIDLPGPAGGRRP